MTSDGRHPVQLQWQRIYRKKSSLINFQLSVLTLPQFYRTQFEHLQWYTSVALWTMYTECKLHSTIHIKSKSCKCVKYLNQQMHMHKTCFIIYTYYYLPTCFDHFCILHQHNFTRILIIQQTAKLYKQNNSML